MIEMIVLPDQTMHVADQTYSVSIGRGGYVAEEKKKEGDGATPCGRYPIRHIYYRDDRIDLPPVRLPASPIKKQDGWCDDPKDVAYNKFVTLPYPASHENLWRDDHVYDVVLSIGHNDAPPIPGKGSAIFIHVARPNYSPTDGCIALMKEDLLSILPKLDKNSYIDIRGCKV